jgi:hypothetical protein
MKKEFKRIKKISKIIIGKKHYNKIKKLRNYEDKTESLKYLVASKLELVFLELEQKVGEIEKKSNAILEAKIIMLPSKIRIFKSTYKKKDYKVIEKLITEIEKEIKCLIS